MNLEKVVFGFFILLAATLNFGFVYGEISNPDHHHFWELFAAIVVNLIATVLKFGDRTHVGAVHLASSLVALLQLVAAALVWFFANQASAEQISAYTMSSIVSLSAGALLANIVSVVIMVIETTMQRR
jgi:Ca2+/H+ antiporter, TMEM165/GDT1 family